MVNQTFAYTSHKTSVYTPSKNHKKAACVLNIIIERNGFPTENQAYSSNADINLVGNTSKSQW